MHTQQETHNRDKWFKRAEQPVLLCNGALEKQKWGQNKDADLIRLLVLQFQLWNIHASDGRNISGFTSSLLPLLIQHI